MKEANLADIVQAFLVQGFTVCYLDRNARRRSMVQMLSNDRGKLLVQTGKLTAYSYPHYHISIAVNSREWAPNERDEWKLIAACWDGKKSMNIEISI